MDEKGYWNGDRKYSVLRPCFISFVSQGTQGQSGPPGPPGTAGSLVSKQRN